MKALRLLIFAIFLLSACKKENTPQPVPLISTVATIPPVIKYDTIPDNAGLKIQLVKDKINTDETMIVFKHLAGNSSSGIDGDAAYFPGYGQESLASVSSDGKDLAINFLPYTRGMAVNLDVNVKTSGAYFLKLSYENKIPSTIKIWLKDTFLKDSVDVRTANYNFTIDKADPNSFGNKRFMLILKDDGQQQTTTTTH
jgi:hypothetical protein